MKPAPLLPDDTIAIVAPGSAPSDPSDLAAGIEYLEAQGYRIIRGRDRYINDGYLSGTDSERIDEFNQLLRNPEVKALFCARGGFGSLRLLPHLDYNAARAHPKLLVGYSDITALQLALFQRAGWASLSGPMVAIDWARPDAETERLFWAFARGSTPQPLLGPDRAHLTPMYPGTAEGILLGGNLSVITRLVGTPYLPSFDGALLFIEDINEPPYRIDGMLAQLRLSGLLERLGGIIIGRFSNWEDAADSPTLTMDEVLDYYTAPLNIPVARGLVYGHIDRKSTLPIGIRARLDVTSEDATLSILEPVVTPPSNAD